MSSHGVEAPPGARETVTVALGCTVTFFFSYFFYGWAAMQALFEQDGVYADVCPPDDLLCSERGSRMVFLFSMDNTTCMFSGVLLGILLDHTGPFTLTVLGGVLQSVALLLMGIGQGDANNLFDPLLGAFVVSGVGGTALMLQSLKLAFIVAPKHFALVMALANCLVDSSSVIPLGLYRLYVAGLSRAWIFSGYAVLCFVSCMALACCWQGRPTARLRAASSRETSSVRGLAPRLHGLSLLTQLRTLEFAFSLTFMATQVFRSNAYLGVVKDLLEDLGDAKLDNLYTQILTILLPASTLFICLFDRLMRQKGFAITFAVVLLLGLTWNGIMLVPNLPLQVLGFAAFTNFRGLLFASFFTFVGHTFGNRTFGRIQALLWASTCLLSLAIWPSRELSKQWTGDLTAMNIFMLLLCVPCILMTVLLARHLRRYPAGDLRPLALPPKELKADKLHSNVSSFSIGSLESSFGI